MTEGQDIFEKYRRENFEGEYLYIGPDEWQEIKDSYPKDVVKEKLAEIAMTYPPPFVNITEEDAISEYRRLKTVRYNEMIKTDESWFPRKAEAPKYSLEYDGSPVLIKRYNGGNKASDFFQQKNRWEVSGSQGPGPLRTWRNHKFMTSLMGALYSLKMTEVSANTLRVCLSLRKYTASQFKPAVAKTLYDYFKAETIIDFSMGWGDRLCGFYASDYGKKYIGLDPKEDNHPIYQKQAEFYKKHNGFFEHEREHVFHCNPAEDFDFSIYKDQVDLIFTSPPYFNVERYSEEESQSWMRYKTIDVWNEHFLHKALGNMIQTLKKGGIMAINISDVFSTSGTERTYLSIVNPMNEYLESQGLIYKGCIGMEMAKRPNSGGAGMARENEVNKWSEESLEAAEETKDQKFGEPIWIFQKD